MMRANAVDLIQVSPEAAGVGTEPSETKRTVFCTVKSIGQQEAYLAMGQGLNPELKVILAHDFEYEGERLCELDGVRYDILRTYITEADGNRRQRSHPRGWAKCRANMKPLWLR